MEEWIAECIRIFETFKTHSLFVEDESERGKSPIIMVNFFILFIFSVCFFFFIHMCIYEAGVQWTNHILNANTKKKQYTFLSFHIFLNFYVNGVKIIFTLTFFCHRDKSIVMKNIHEIMTYRTIHTEQYAIIVGSWLRISYIEIECVDLN